MGRLYFRWEKKMIINTRKIVLYLIIPIIVSSSFLSGCSLLTGRQGKVPKIDMIVDNPLPVKRTDEFVVLKVDFLKDMFPDFSPNAFIAVEADSNQEIPNQVDDMNNDGLGDEIVMVLDMEPGERKKITLRYAPEGRGVSLGYDKRTRAAIHPEFGGVGWESHLIAYRLYPDYRNSISVFGKQEPGLSLDKFALSAKAGDGYNKLEPWGVSILEGGKSIGCGGFGIWNQDKLVKPLNMMNGSPPEPDERVFPYTRIVADGPVRSVVQVIFDNWRIGDQNLMVTATYSIYAGQRWTRNDIKIEGADKPVKIATGLVKSASGKLIRDDESGFFYTWGAQSHRDTPDDMGMALIYPTESFDSFHENVDHADSFFSDETEAYISVLNPGADNEITYWFITAWNRGDIGIKRDREFADILSSLVENLKHPLTVTVMPGKPDTEGQEQQETN
jgi:hypothetical protein